MILGDSGNSLWLGLFIIVLCTLLAGYTLIALVHGAVALVKRWRKRP